MKRRQVYTADVETDFCDTTSRCLECGAVFVIPGNTFPENPDECATCTGGRAPRGVASLFDDCEDM